MKINEFGTKRWRNSKNQLHRKNGPAVIFTNGRMHWFINDKPHRIDGPALAWNVAKFWCWRLYGEDIRKFEFD